MNAVTTTEIVPAEKPTRQLLMVTDPVPMLDTARFEHMQRVATVMADCSLMPATLQGKEFRQSVANCFMVVNFAVQARMDPFAVAQCASVIHGKLCFEGKLIAAMIAAKLGIDLEYEWNDKQGDAFAIVVFATVDGKRKEIRGTVGDWKTKDKQGNINGQWVGNKARMQLAYRGSREWCRLHKPGIMLGVYSDDEMAASSELRDVTPIERSAPPVPPRPPVPPVVGTETVDAETGEVIDSREIVTETGEATDALVDESGAEGADYFTRLKAALEAASNAAEIAEVWAEADPLAHFEGDDDAQAAALSMKRENVKRVSK